MNERAESLRWLPRFVTIVLGVPAGVSLVLAALRPADVSWVFAGSVVALFCMIQLLARRAGPQRARWLLAACSLCLMLWPELALRAAGLRFDRAGTLVGVWQPDRMVEAKRHPDLFWTLPPGSDSVNAEGFLGPEFRIPKPQGVYRIVFLGDSCTQQGYPALVASRLNATFSDDRVFEAINLGVAGYTSHQGRVAAERWLEALEPDLTVVYFGWNDHWRARVVSDSERAKWSRAAITRLLSASRLAQGVLMLSGSIWPEPLEEPRVGLEEYAANLRDIAVTARAAGSVVLLLTAPSSHARLGVPGDLIRRDYAASKQRVLEWHGAYNAEVEPVARAGGWRFLDLAGAADVEDIAALRRIFRRDGIHFTGQGLAWVATRIADEIALERSGAPLRRQSSSTSR